ncbi:MAG TPA: DUF6776 family protein [Porticoccaceae bacterium]|nr:DUF6776 family protein [Porticoccaceae bacterium]
MLRVLVRRWAPRFPLVVLVLAAAGTGLLIGHWQGQEAAVPHETDRGKLRRQLAAERQRGAQLEQQLANRMLAAEVDWRAMAQVRQLMTDLDQRIAVQEEELNLYRLLLQPDNGIKGLHVEHWRATAAAEPGAYDYRLVVRQNVDLRESMQVSLKVVLLGETAGEPVTFTLAELDEGVDREVVPLSFRYFKFFDGKLVLPPGFTPREVEVSVWPRGKQDELRTRNFPWAPGTGTPATTLTN